jgi:Ca2+-binding RTX toxin-like protein/chitodextrinase
VTFCVAGSPLQPCATVFGESPDGIWRTSRDTLDLQDGPNTVYAYVTYADPLDQSHSLSTSTIVNVDNTTPSVELTASPARGPAPLAATATISAYQPRGVTLDYRLDFDDGSPPESGTIAAPYGPVHFEHVYTTPGTYRMRVSVSDGHGHSATRSQQVVAESVEDTTPPTTTITDGPIGSVARDSATFAFKSNEPAASFACALDTPGFSACDSLVTYDQLGEGGHSFSVRATDAAGNTGPAATRHFTVDTVVPETSIDSGPSGPTVDRLPAFDFSSNEAGTFRCALTSVFPEPCATPKSYSLLTDGEYTFSVYAVDAAGNVDPTPATRSITLDTAPPETTLAGGPTGPLHDGELAYRYESTEAGIVQCAVDDKPFEDCAGRQFEAGEFSLGVHIFRARAVDQAGNADQSPAEAQFTIANILPHASLSLSRNAGPAQLDLTATVEGRDDDGDGLRYDLAFGDGTTASGTLPAAPVEHRYSEPGVYQARLDVSDGHDHAIATDTVTVTLPEPLQPHAGDDQTVVVGEPVTLDGGDSRPLGGIDSYEWSFGDGESASGAAVEHTYSAPGDYAARLITRRGQETESDSATIYVIPRPSEDGVAVDVRSGGSPVPGADVLVILPDGTKVQATSNAGGVARLFGLPDGDYRVYAYKPGYVPTTGSATAAGGRGAGSVELKAGETATARIESHPMTLEEIEAAGIDPDDPDNQHVYQFEVHLTVAGSRDSFGGYIGAGGFIGSEHCAQQLCEHCTQRLCIWSVGGATIYTSVQVIDGAPIMSSLVIPFKATWLKQFYDVSLIVDNLASPGFTLDSGHATISVPDGLSLAPTSAPQALTTALPDIPGGGSAAAHWVLRGDKEGMYDMAATYAGTLQPFGRTVRLEGRTSTPIHVWGGSALNITVDVDKQVRDGYPFLARVGLKNVADVSVYNPAVELLKQGGEGYIEQPRQQRSFGTREIKPGETFWGGPFVLVPNSSGTVDLSHAFIQKTAGDVSPDTFIVTHDRVPAFADTPTISATNRKDAVALTFDPIPGATDYEVYATSDRNTGFSDTPLPDRVLRDGKLMVDAPADQLRYLAISTIRDGKREMLHPLVNSRADATEEFPSIYIDDCGTDSGSVDVTIADLDLGLDRWQYKIGDGEWVNGGDISNFVQTSVSIGVPYPDYVPPILAVRAANDDQADAGPDVWGPTVRCRLTNREHLGYGFVNRGMDDYADGAGIGRDDILTDTVISTTFNDLDSDLGSVFEDAADSLWNVMSEGTCFGLALSGGRFDVGADDLSDASAARTAPEWKVADENELVTPDRLFSQDHPTYTKELLRLLAGSYIAQFDEDFLAGQEAQRAQYAASPSAGTDLRERIKRAMAQGTDPDTRLNGPAQTGLALISFFNTADDEGHAVLAHGLRDRPGGGFFIEVWDNNHPGENKSIEVDPDGAWSYGPLGWSGTLHSPASRADVVLASPLLAPRGLHYLNAVLPHASTGMTVADVDSTTRVGDAANADGSEPWVRPIPGPTTYAGASIVFHGARGSARLEGDQPSVLVRGNGMLLRAERSGGGTSDLGLSFDTQTGSISVTGGPASLTVMRNGETHQVSDASQLTVSSDGTETSIPYKPPLSGRASGVVRDTSGNPVAGATVTLERADLMSGPFGDVPGGSSVMGPSNRSNPDTTGVDGQFGWDLTSGYYKVRAQRVGCHAPGHAGATSVVSGLLTIPPPATDIELKLDCRPPPRICMGKAATVPGVNGTPGNDVIVGTNGGETIRAYGGHDIICANGGDDHVVGGNGSDVISGGPGADDIDGGPAVDRVTYSDSLTDVVVTIDNVADDGPVAGGAAEHDNVRTTVERVDGGHGNDVLTGNGKANMLHGNAGRDTLTGGRGKDLLVGEDGNDTLVGRDGVKFDRLVCGGGRDHYSADTADLVARSCEIAL